MESRKRGEKSKPRTKFALRYPFAEPYNGNLRAAADGHPFIGRTTPGASLRIRQLGTGIVSRSLQQVSRYLTNYRASMFFASPILLARPANLSLFSSCNLSYLLI
jgi:hypothetical protein